MFGLHYLTDSIGFKKVIIRSLVVIFGLLWGSHLYGIWASSDTRLVSVYTTYSDDVRIGYVGEGNAQVRYLDIGNPTFPTLILLHGSPGSITTFDALIKDTALLASYRLIIPDRPGYVGSYHGTAVTSLREQTDLLAPLLTLNQHEILPIIIGHSLGGTLVGTFLMRYPEYVSSGIVVAGAVDPEHEKIWKISYVLDLPPLRWMIPPALRVTNDEKLTHVAELQAIQPLRKDITHPLTVMHGDADRIVPVENAAFIEREAISADLDMRVQSERDHFLPFDRAGTIEQAVDDMWEKLEGSK